MKRKPISGKVRSPWVEDHERLAGMRDGVHIEADARYFWRNTHDGRLRVIAGTIPGLGLHLSVSHVDHRSEPDRYPTWDEIADARDKLLDPDREYVMYLPKQEDYVAVHPTTFHLHEAIPDGVLELQGRRFQIALCAGEGGEIMVDAESQLPLAVLSPWTPDEWVSPFDGDGLSVGAATVTALPPPPSEGVPDEPHTDTAQDRR